MIIPLATVSQTFLIDSCVLFDVDVFSWAMCFIQTVFFGFALVSSYKLYQYFNAYFVSEPKKTTRQKVMTKSSNDVLSIALQHGVNAEGQLYRLKRGAKLRIVPGSSLLGRHVALYCNYPVTGEFPQFIANSKSVTNIFTHSNIISNHHLFVSIYCWIRTLTHTESEDGKFQSSFFHLSSNLCVNSNKESNAY